MSLEEIRGALLSKKGCLVNLTSDGRNLKSAEKFVRKYFDFLPTSSPLSTSSTSNTLLLSENEAYTIPTQVGLCFLVIGFKLEVAKWAGQTNRVIGHFDTG